MNVPQRCAAEADSGRNIGQAAFHEHHVRSVDRNVGSRSDRDAYIRAGERRSVVHAVADHDDFSLFLESADDALLAVGKYAGNDLVHAGFCADSLCRALVIAGEHNNVYAHVPHLLYGLRTVVLYDVGNGDYADKRSAACKKQRSFPFLGQALGSFCRFIGYCYLSAYEFEAAAEKLRSVKRRGKAVSGQGFKALDLKSSELFLLCPLSYRAS